MLFDDERRRVTTIQIGTAMFSLATTATVQAVADIF
jgi:hypothetical protein